MPELGPSAVEILTNDFSYKKSFLTDKINALACGGAGLILAFYINWGQRKPLLSGIQKHIGFTLAGLFIGHTLEKWRTDYLAEKDAILRHYVELHPDEFPREQRMKFKEVLEPWIPIR